MFHLWTVWRYGSGTMREVWQTYHGFDAPWPPVLNSERLATLAMSFGMFADERERQLAGHKVQRRQLGG
jgi:hypothetical protein